MSSQYVVIGAGLAGAAAAWSLARRGHDVTLVERTRPAAHDGSSHGSARILRYAYPNPFLHRAGRPRAGRFDELERLSGNKLITPTGSLDFGRVRDPRRLAAVMERSVSSTSWSATSWRGPGSRSSPRTPRCCGSRCRHRFAAGGLSVRSS